MALTANANHEAERGRGGFHAWKMRGIRGAFIGCKAPNYLAVNSCNAAYAAVNADAGLKSSSKASCLRKCLQRRAPEKRFRAAKTSQRWNSQFSLGFSSAYSNAFYPILTFCNRHALFYMLCLRAPLFHRNRFPCPWSRLPKMEQVRGGNPFGDTEPLFIAFRPLWTTKRHTKER